jgi:hypothetical protein
VVEYGIGPSVEFFRLLVSSIATTCWARLKTVLDLLTDYLASEMIAFEKQPETEVRAL